MFTETQTQPGKAENSVKHSTCTNYSVKGSQGKGGCFRLRQFSFYVSLKSHLATIHLLLVVSHQSKTSNLHVLSQLDYRTTGTTSREGAMHTYKALLTAWRFQQAVNSSFGFHPRGETGHQSSSSHQCTSFTKQPCFQWRNIGCVLQHLFTIHCASVGRASQHERNIFMHVHEKELYGFRTDESAANKKNKNTNPLGHYGTLKQGIKNIRSQLITFFRPNYFLFLNTNTSRADLHMNRSAEL